MKMIAIKDDHGSCNVYVDGTLDKLHQVFDEHKITTAKKMFLVTDENVNRIHARKIDSMNEMHPFKKFVISPGEENKNYSTIESIYKFLMENDCDRNSIIVALGGGVTGDLAAFAASTYMRGIKFINIPTTLLSQVDSCIGGKTGYNFGNVKNAIGTFYNPEFVFICTNFLKTLSAADFRSGLGEVVKYGLTGSGNLLKYMEENYKGILEMESDKLQHLIRECIRMKGEVITQDFMDVGLRNVLNFGHTVGHAIEMDSRYAVSHGEAIALGILVALELSEKKLNLPENVYNEMIRLYKKIGLPTHYEIRNLNVVLHALRHDKKNNDSLRFVLLEDIEKCKLKVEIKESEVLEALKNSIFKED